DGCELPFLPSLEGDSIDSAFSECSTPESEVSQSTGSAATQDSGVTTISIAPVAAWPAWELHTPSDEYDETWQAQAQERVLAQAHKETQTATLTLTQSVPESQSQSQSQSQLQSPLQSQLQSHKLSKQELLELCMAAALAAVSPLRQRPRMLAARDESRSAADEHCVAEHFVQGTECWAHC
ncbi:MAG: hypothetical protein MHM6MM_009513, partial [Cercozoa sp. M6MM]